MTDRPLRIGTRGSRLALAQAYETRRRLAAVHGWADDDLEARCEIHKISTAGDRIQDKALRAFGGKGLFTKEIEDALLDGRIDLAVHSMIITPAPAAVYLNGKEIEYNASGPTQLPEGLTLTAFLPREDPRDAFFGRACARLADLPAGAVVGAASLRRQAQVLRARPDLKVETIRGTVETRLRKLADGEVDATFLALAGLRRLGLADKASSICETDDMLPAVAQGAIGLEIRDDDEATRAALAPINDRETEIRLSAERAFLAVLDGSCRTPMACLAERDGDALRVRGEILSPDGAQAFGGARRGALGADPRADAAELGRDLGADLAAQAGPVFLDAIRG